MGRPIHGNSEEKLVEAARGMTKSSLNIARISSSKSESPFRFVGRTSEIILPIF